ncbi:MAG: IS1595 family transposase [Kiritimatiellales bacterium]
MSNKYIFHSRISEHDFRRIIRYFSVDIEASKMAVLTGLSRNTTQVVKNCSVKELLPIIQQKVDTESIVYTDGFKSYDGLVNFGYRKHYRIHHGENEFAAGRNHINGIENFWSIAKVRLSKFRGIHKSTFYLHLKECEFRFNHRHENLYQILLKMFRKRPFNLS